MEDHPIQWNMANTLEQLGGDYPLLQEVLEIFLREAPQHLAALGLAVKQGDAEQLESMAHTMKGELGYLDVPEISRRARELEERGQARDVAGAAVIFPLFEADLSSLFRSIRNSAAMTEPAQVSSPSPSSPW